MRRKRDRDQKSTIELLPAEAKADVSWAIAEIEAGGRLYKDIFAEFNARLADRGIGPISKSAFSRFALRKRLLTEGLRDVRELSAAITKDLDPEDDDAVTVMLVQMVRTLMFELVESIRNGDRKIDPKGTLELSRALQSLMSAQRMSSERRKALQDEIDKTVEKAVETVAKAKGMTAETAEAIKAQILGVKAAA